MTKKIVYYRNWDDMPVVLNLSQCAIILGITYCTARNWAERGKIPAVKIADEWRVEKSCLEAMFNLKK